MALNLPIQIYRGLNANVASAVATTPGIFAYTTDSHRLFVSDGSSFNPIANDIAVFTAANQAAMVALAAKVGDICDRTDLHQIFVLTSFPASTVGNWTAIAPDASVTGIVGLASGTAHEWVSFIDTAGVQHLTQPAFSDISGQLSQTQLPTTIGAGTSLTVIDCGTF